MQMFKIHDQFGPEVVWKYRFVFFEAHVYLVCLKLSMVQDSRQKRFKYLRQRKYQMEQRWHVQVNQDIKKIHDCRKHKNQSLLHSVIVLPYYSSPRSSKVICHFFSQKEVVWHFHSQKRSDMPFQMIVKRNILDHSKLSAAQTYGMVSASKNTGCPFSEDRFNFTTISLVFKIICAYNLLSGKQFTTLLFYSLSLENKACVSMH